MNETFRFIGFESGKLEQVDRIIVHQFDPSQPSPGGIDTCIRGLCKFMPESTRLAIVGVAAGEGPKGRKIGVWEHYSIGTRRVSFLPVATLDPSEQARFRIPHSARLVVGALRHVRRLPKAEIYQAHRADTALVLRLFAKSRFSYFIHTQDQGITSSSSDSLWTRAAEIHEAIERRVIRSSDSVVVFNESYASSVKELNPAAIFSPTWFDPDLIAQVDHEKGYDVVWVGRLEKPKDPILALRAFSSLLNSNREKPWKLTVIGSGVLSEELRSIAKDINSQFGTRIILAGRLSPSDVADRLSSADVFLMTSQPGYEGYPRVLVESMASGLIPVVTEGSDTGGLIENGTNGFVTSRDPEDLAACLSEARSIDPHLAIRSVVDLSAPGVVTRIFERSI